jgi:type IX secretion system PorP/SprF family membrane protein
MTGNLLSQEISSVSLFEQNLIYYNPGSTGNQEVLAANFFYRAQWIGFSNGTPSIQVFCAHAPLRKPSVAMGVQVEHDALGICNYTGVYIHYAYRVSLGANRLSFGLRGGVASLSQGTVTLRDNPDRAFDEDNQTSYLPNFGAGILFYGQYYWAGVSIPRLFGFKHQASGMYTIDPGFNHYEYFFTGGGKLPAGSNLSFEPSALVAYSSSYPLRFTLLGMAVYKHAYKAGVGFRLHEAIFLAIGYQLNRQFSLGYSYDFNIGKVLKLTSGSHEINVSYKFGYRVNASNPRDFTR